MSLNFFNSPIKQEINETIKPKNETPSPNADAEPLDDNINAIPKSDIEIPKSDKRIITSPSYKLLQENYTIFSPTKLPVTSMNKRGAAAKHTPPLKCPVSLTL